MLDDFTRKLSDLQRRAQELDGENEVSFQDLFPDEFILRHTDFPSIAELIEQSPFEVNSAEDFKAIPDEEWDSYISEHTRFSSWAQMMSAAGQEWAVRRLDLG